MFCIWLQNARKTLGLTQKELAAHLKLSASTLGMYEQGRRRPSPKAKARLRMFFSRTEIGSPSTFLPGAPANRQFRQEVQASRHPSPHP